MKRLAIALVVPAVVVAVLAAGASGRAAATFKWCTDPSFPPMEYTTTSGKIVGFDADMAVALAKTWGGTASAAKTAFPRSHSGAEREEMRRGDQRHLHHA